MRGRPRWMSDASVREQRNHKRRMDRRKSAVFEPTLFFAKQKDAREKKQGKHSNFSKSMSLGFALISTFSRASAPRQSLRSPASSLRRADEPARRPPRGAKALDRASQKPEVLQPKLLVPRRGIKESEEDCIHDLLSSTGQNVPFHFLIFSYRTSSFPRTSVEVPREKKEGVQWGEEVTLVFRQSQLCNANSEFAFWLGLLD